MGESIVLSIIMINFNDFMYKIFAIQTILRILDTTVTGL